MKIAAGKFKAICLKLMDSVEKGQEEIIITKRGKPVAKLVSCGVREPSPPAYGALKGTMTIKGNIVDPVGEVWDANQ